MFALSANNDEELYYYKLCKSQLDLSSMNLTSQNSAFGTVNSSLPLTPGNINFSGGKAINLNPEFQTNSIGVFKAEIKGCL